VSKIHNHAGSHCWMGVAEGPLIETLYGVEKDGQVLVEGECPVAAGSCCPKMIQMRRSLFQKGEVAYASDRIGLHTVSSDTVDAVSVHLYAPPIVAAKIYDPERNIVYEKRLGDFDSCPCVNPQTVNTSHSSALTSSTSV